MSLLYFKVSAYFKSCTSCSCDFHTMACLHDMTKSRMSLRHAETSSSYVEGVSKLQMCQVQTNACNHYIPLWSFINSCCVAIFWCQLQARRSERLRPHVNKRNMGEPGLLGTESCCAICLEAPVCFYICFEPYRDPVPGTTCILCQYAR